jgi:ATP-dependent helicase/nuclease subunit A
MTRIPADQPARDRVRLELDVNMLVEAGAGSGKTTALVGRMVEHVRRGTAVERLTAVTFTRKAANELRERFQVGLERAIRESAAGSNERERFERALRELDRAFLGTIHSFCARLLRERPLEVGLDPSFQEISEEAWEELQRHSWRRWVERARRDGDAGLGALATVGLEPSMLYQGFKTVVQYPDVAFPVGSSAPPDVSDCRRELDALLVAARAAMPREEPADGWDPLMKLVRRLEFLRSVGSFDTVAGFCDALESITESHFELTQKRWSDSKEGKTRAKALSDDFRALLSGRIADVLRCWREHRYPIVMDVLRRAAADFARERHATGQLSFEDLLLLTARLLRENPAVRDELGARYAHLLVDEFQDTDPIQAEVCLLLTSDSTTGDDWRTAVPRPGALFVVGDPKQSIYRFRRADIQIYELVKRRMATFGVVVPLTANFRSVSSIEAVVNGHFASVFPVEATAEQAPYRPMETQDEPAGEDGVRYHVVRYDGASSTERTLAADSEALASWIASRIDSGAKCAGDFMVLCATRPPIERYARALAERNVPVVTTGAKLPQEQELRELLVVLRALADPENAVGVVAALEGLFFGLSPADLWAASRRGIRFAVTHRPADESDAAALALLQLHEWWQCSQRQPADVLLERILDESGLLPYAAAQPLGEARAGALLHLVHSLRAASTLGASGLPEAMEWLETMLHAEAADAPLRPGRTDAVRVMNVHKAKGLEANVVVLAAPIDRPTFEPQVHVARQDDGATGGLCIHGHVGSSTRVLAQPPGWAEMQAIEARFQEAERARVLYVAATRAERELLVSQCERTLKSSVAHDRSAWRPLAPVLDEFAIPVVLPVTAAPGRARLQQSASSLTEAARDAVQRVGTAATPTVRFATVTGEIRDARRELAPDGTRVSSRSHGAAWGTAVHRSLEAMGRGRSGDSLRAFALAVARDEGLDAESAAELFPLLQRTAASAAWRTLLAAGQASFELPVMSRSTDTGIETITEGIVDAAALGANGWHVADWKTDAVDDASWASRRERYTRQVDAYVRALASLSGRPAAGVVERIR